MSLTSKKQAVSVYDNRYFFFQFVIAFCLYIFHYYIFLKQRKTYFFINLNETLGIKVVSQ